MTSAPSDAERIYKSKVAALGGAGLNFKISDGSHVDARLYAESIMEALARAKLQRAGAQATPSRVYDALEDREHEYGLVPGGSDTIPTRKRALAAAWLLPGGAGRINVDNTLLALLGDDFVGFRTSVGDTIVTYPTNLGDQPQNLQLDTVPRRLVTIDSAISTGLGSPQTVAYTCVEPIDTPLLAGDTVVVDGQNIALSERVAITASTIPSPFVGTGTITGTFTNAHGPGATATTQPWPLWTSNVRSVMVIVKPAAAADAETRRLLNNLMQKLMRGVTTWSIVEETTPAGTAGPFQIGVSPLGLTPLGAVSVP